MKKNNRKENRENKKIASIKKINEKEQRRNTYSKKFAT